MNEKHNTRRHMVLIDPDAKTITTADMTPKEVARWISGDPNSEGFDAERYVHDETFEVWLDEDGRSKGLTPWLIHHSPKGCTCGKCMDAMTFTMLAGRGALSIALEIDNGNTGYPKPSAEMLAEGFTPEFMVGGIVRFINPRMMSRAKRLLQEGGQFAIITDDESMKEAVEKRHQLDAMVSMLAIASEPVTKLDDKTIEKFIKLSTKKLAKLTTKDDDETKTSTDVSRN